MKKILIAFVVLINCFLHAQLSNKHWLPPMHSLSADVVDDHFLYLSTNITTPFQVKVTYGDGQELPNSPYTLSKAAPIRINIGSSQPSPMMVSKSQLLTPISNDRGFILEADEDFYVSFRIRTTNHAETLISKGRVGLGTSFRLGSLPMSSSGSLRNFVSSIMATEDNTNVVINDYNSGVIFETAGAQNTNNSLSVTLNAGESYVMSGYSETTVSNLSGFVGALVTSDKPIAVSTGNYLAGMNIPDEGQDITFDQIVGEEQIGKEYIFVKGNGSDLVENPLIIATQDNTQLFVNGSTTPIATIDAGEFFLIPASNYQGTSSKNIFLETSEKVFAYQIVGGNESDATSGMYFVPPLSCFFQNEVTIPKVEEIGNTNYNMSLFVLTTTGSAVQINGEAITVPAQTVQGNPNWLSYRVDGVFGDLSVTSDGPLAVGVFGSLDVAGFGGYYSGFGSEPKDTNAILCSSETVSLLEEVEGNPPTGGVWTVPVGGPPIVNDIFNPNVNIPGTYLYSFQKTCGSEILNRQITINVSIEQAMNPGTSNTRAVCKNDASFELFPLLGVNAVSGGVWTVPAGAPAITGSTFNPAVNISGVYTYTLAATANCPVQTATVTVTNSDLPLINNAITDYELCDTTADGSDTNGFVMFNLNTKIAEILNGQTGMTVSFHTDLSEAESNSVVLPTNYYSDTKNIFYRITNNVTSCFSTGSFKIVVRQLPVINTTVQLFNCDDDVNAQTFFNLTEAQSLLTTTPNVSFKYYNSLVNANADTNAFDMTLTENYLAFNNNVVWVRVTNEFGCFRVTSFTLRVSVTQVPSSYQFTINQCDDFETDASGADVVGSDVDGIDTFNLTTVENDPSQGISTTILVNNPDVSYSYYLSEQDALTENNAIINPTAFRNTIPNTQIIWVRIDSNINNSCTGLGAFIRLVVNPLPDFTIPTEQLICVDPASGQGSFSIDATPLSLATLGYTYDWTPNNPETTGGFENAVFNATEEGTYSVEVTNVETGCKRTMQTVLNVSSPPEDLTFTLLTPIFSGGLSSVQANAIGGFGEYEFSLDLVNWQDSPVFTNLQNGTYTLYARDKTGCAGILNTREFVTITYPNYFTPNGDSYNDTWNINGLSSDYRAKIFIFDRYGKLLKQVNPYADTGWDGTFNGQLLPATDYWFVIEYLEDGATKQFKSHFSLKR
jgi:gliding motility-associated-like protein